MAERKKVVKKARPAAKRAKRAQHTGQTTERAVVDYLERHADFFKNRAELLQKMDLPHGTDTVPSLLDKRMALLEEEKEQLEEKVRGFIATADMNEKSSVRIYRIGRDLLRMLRCGEDATAETCCTIMRRHFRDLNFDILVFSDATDLGRRRVKFDDRRIAGVVRRAFARRELSCGPFNAAERTVLFGADAKRIGSVLVAPLGGYGDAEPYALLVVTSGDPMRFSPGRGTMFLLQLGELLEAALGVDGVGR